MEKTLSTGRRPAPYGRACVQCARAKCRCMLRSTGSDCERCLRLGKECQQAPVVRKRKSRVTSADAARLEQKLDGLVSLLKSNQPSSKVGNVAKNSHWNVREVSQQLDESDISTASDGQIAANTFNAFTNQSSGQPLTPHSISSGHPSPYSFPPGVEPTPEEAERYLDIFRTKRLKYFPFFQIPHDMSSEKLRRDHPFLWLCIMASVPHTPPQLYGLGRKVREVAAREILVEGERTLDLLRGLLVFVGWGHFYVYHSPILSAFTNLCLSVLFDMELHKPAVRDPVKLMKCTSNFDPNLRIPQTRTMEHIRLALACYSLSSSVSSFPGKLEPMRWSPYLEECWQLMAANPEWPSDHCFLHMIRLQRITEKAVGICNQNRLSENMEELKASQLYMKALRSELSDTKNRIPQHLLEDEMAINEIATTCAPLLALMPDNRLEIIEGLYTCLQCCKAWFDILFQLPLSEFLEFSTPNFHQLKGCLFGLYRLTLVNDPAFDAQYVRKIADFALIIDRLVEKLQKAKDNTVEWPAEQDGFAKTVRGLTILKNFAAAGLLTDQNQGTASDDSFSELAAWPRIDENEIWLNDILGNWEL